MRDDAPRSPRLYSTTLALGSIFIAAVPVGVDFNRVGRASLAMPIAEFLAQLSQSRKAKAGARPPLQSAALLAPGLAVAEVPLSPVGGLNQTKSGGSPPGKSAAAALHAALDRGQNEKARELLAQILEQPRLDADLLLDIGVSLAQRELYPEAARAFARCVKDHPAIFEGHYNLALAQFALHALPEALQSLEKTSPGSKEQELARLYLRGKIEEGLKRTADADRDLSAAFSGAPEQENYALDLGLFYLRQRSYPRAAEVFESGVSRSPRSSFLLLGFALAQYLGGRPAESVQTCKKLIALDPNFSPARLLLAFALYMAGDLPAAQEVAAAGLNEPSPHPFLYYLHATILVKLQSKDYPRMVNELAVAARRIPACSLCYLTESKVHQALGNPQAAIADLETAVHMDPGFPEAWYRLAPLYERVGRKADAARARAHFRELKAEKSSHETEALRNMFLETLGGSEPSTPPR